jgi:hypothetical protein
MNGVMPVVYVTTTLLHETARLLVSFAEVEDGEGVVYWFGLQLGDQAIVTTLVVPNADTTGGRVSTSASSNAEALGAIVGTPLVLIGQAHSHPFEYVGHSSVDDRDTFAQFPGAISVVVPFLGREGIDLPTCGVHRHIDGKFRRIRSSQTHKHIRVLPGLADFRAVRQHV